MLQAAAIGFGAFLLFLIQPMISKVILPVFGGSSYVWLAGLIFFQTGLLAGYATAHGLARRLAGWAHVAAVVVLVGAACAFIPLKPRLMDAAMAPPWGILLVLAATCGIPYLILSMTSPLVQHWIARTGASKTAKNPYVLYAVSNAGSLLGLLGYPLVLGPRIGNQWLMNLWSWGFLLYALLMAACLVSYARKSRGDEIIPQKAPDAPESAKPLFPARLRWLYQALIPSAALMVFTHYITQDIANMPLLWVVPLALYLLTFVICFQFPGLSRPHFVRSGILMAPVLVMGAILWFGLEASALVKIALSLVTLFSICMFFHGNLEHEKPAPAHLTSFYMHLSVGGALGGILMGIAAPLVFRSTVEFNLVLAAAFWFMALSVIPRNARTVRLAFHAEMAVLVLATGVIYEVRHLKPVVHRDRSFFAAYEILQYKRSVDWPRPLRYMRVGTTIHGGQTRDENGNLMPISYFHPASGVGKALTRMTNISRVGVVGLGTGVVALYGEPGQEYDFFEIDPLVKKLAEERFDILKESRAEIRFFVGDARIRLKEIPDNAYDCLVLDAFTGDAIPTHLLTREAFEEYERVLKPDGALLFHISNHYANLVPVLKCHADRMGLFLALHYSDNQNTAYLHPALWAALAKDPARMKEITANDPAWFRPHDKTVCWTDDFNDLLPVIHLITPPIYEILNRTPPKD